jgi:hypothetical protein
MIPITGAPAWLSVGWLIALLVLILTLIFLALGQVDQKTGLLIGGVALARLL